MRKLLIILQINFIILSFCCAEISESISKYFNQNYVIKEYHDVESKLSDGVLFETLQNSAGEELYRLSLFSSLGKTVYTCIYSEKEEVWYLEKKSIFYNEPYNQKDYEQEVSIFRYADTCYKLTGEKFVKDTDVNSAPAVVDFRSAKSIIELIEKERKKGN